MDALREPSDHGRGWGVTDETLEMRATCFSHAAIAHVRLRGVREGGRILTETASEFTRRGPTTHETLEVSNVSRSVSDTRR